MRTMLLRVLASSCLLLFIGASRAQDAVRLPIHASLIESAAPYDDGVVIKLNPEGTEFLKLFTRDHVGQLIEIAVPGYPALRFVVRTEISSGRLQYKAPILELRN